MLECVYIFLGSSVFKIPFRDILPFISGISEVEPFNLNASVV
jgi:hypothetical protein